MEAPIGDKTQKDDYAVNVSKKTTFMKEVWTDNSGGGCMIDWIELKDGRFIGITDESICIYPHFEAWTEGKDDDKIECLMITD